MTDAVIGRLFAGPRIVDVSRRNELESTTAPNGWFIGPADSPDRFQLLGPGLGGGEGITWRARYADSDAPIPFTLAVKQLRRPPGARADWPTPGDVQRWVEQKELLAYLGLDHLATLVDIFVGSAPHLEGDVPSPLTPTDTPYVVMEWISGRTLLDEFGGTAATASTLGNRLTHLQHITEALHAVHVRTAYGTVGTPALLRDVKPDNCVIDPARGAVLVDVGTMRLVEDGYQHPGFHHPGYTAPEVLDQPTAAREASADLYSLGALAYFCLLGEDPPPLAGQPDAGQLIGRRLLSAARVARVLDPPGFVDHLRLMLHPQPDARPADAVAWAKRLRALAVRRRRTARVGARIVLATVAAVASGFALTEASARYDSSTAAGILATRPGAAGARTVPAPSPTVDPSGTNTASNPADTVDTSGVVASANAVNTADPAAPKGKADAVDRLDAVDISEPADGSTVGQCGFIQGTAALRPGRTLLLSAHSRSPSAGPARRLGPVAGWSAPASLDVWRATTTAFRTLGRPTIAHSYQVDVLVVGLDDLRELMKQAQSDGEDWRKKPPPPSAETVATLTLTRLPGVC
jgi:serine/threonine-protein kinase